jgi:hypothetical protein
VRFRFGALSQDFCTSGEKVRVFKGNFCSISRRQRLPGRSDNLVAAVLLERQEKSLSLSVSDYREVPDDVVRSGWFLSNVPEFQTSEAVPRG